MDDPATLSAADAREARREALRSAARELTALLGIDRRHAKFPGREADAALFGPRALALSCEVVDHFGALGPGEGPHAADEGIRRHVRAYRHGVWRGRYEALNAAFLAHADGRSLVSPRTGGEAGILGSMTVGPYQATLCLDGGRVTVFVGIGHMPILSYDFADHLMIVLTDFRVDMRGALHAVLVPMLADAAGWRDWFRRAREGRLRRAYVIGDNRPGHFMRQSLAYLDRREAEIRDFAARGGVLAAVPDWCAMDPFAAFPALAEAERITVPSARLTTTLVAGGYDAHRVYRCNAYPDAAWLRRRFEALPAGAQGGGAPALAPEAGRLRVMISVDAERERVLNQDEAFGFVLRRLGRACAAAGMVLDVVWDGWTVSGVASPRDLEVIGRIEAAIGRILAGPGIVLGRQVRVFGLSAQAKLGAVAACDLAFVTLGTAAMVPCWLLRRPTVTYHVARLAANREYLDETVAFAVDQRAVVEEPEAVARSGHGSRFSLLPWGLERAMRAALAGRLEVPLEEAEGAA